MAHSYVNLTYHLVFATRHREPWLDDDLRPALFAQMGAIVKKEGGMSLRINGVVDHVHLLVKLHQDHRVSEIVCDIKCRTSGWIHRTRPDLARFAWQAGYGAFTVSQSNVEGVQDYIDDQEEHHRRRDLQSEYLALCRKHGVEADPSSLWE
ncbi:MAG: IS200/IS605 family transposase [Gemmataceae bacterium]